LKSIHILLALNSIIVSVNVHHSFAQSAQVIPFIKNVGGRVDWAVKTIVYDHLNLNDFYSVSVIQPNGTGYADLTKGKAGCPQRNNGNPAISPSGRYIVFQAEKDSAFDSADVHFGPSILSTPGSGINCDLWVLDTKNSVFTRLTDIPTKKTLSDTTKLTGVLHPQFSHDGHKLLWGQCIDASGGNGYGYWELKISDFDTSAGFPKLINTMHYDSGGVLGHFTFIETSGGFSPNDSVIIYCANAKEGQPVEQMDIYTFNFYTQKLVDLTPDTLEYDEHSHFNHDGTKVLWMTDRNIPNDSIASAKTDYWLMNSDGSAKTQLTFFNDTTSTDYRNFSRGGRIIASDNTWSPFGSDTALCYLQIYDSTGAYHEEDVFLIIPPAITLVSGLPANDNVLSCFPNPTSGMLTVSGIRSTEPYNVEVYDLPGQLLYKSKNECILNVAALQSGMYFLKIRSGTFSQVLRFQKF
jgi:Tol biopolymer transport system component